MSPTLFWLIVVTLSKVTVPFLISRLAILPPKRVVLVISKLPSFKRTGAAQYEINELIILLFPNEKTLHIFSGLLAVGEKPENGFPNTLTLFSTALLRHIR